MASTADSNRLCAPATIQCAGSAQAKRGSPSSQDFVRVFLDVKTKSCAIVNAASVSLLGFNVYMFPAGHEIYYDVFSYDEAGFNSVSLSVPGVRSELGKTKAGFASNFAGTATMSAVSSIGGTTYTMRIVFETNGATHISIVAAIVTAARTS
jgi:hypothetical protein